MWVHSLETTISFHKLLKKTKEVGYSSGKHVIKESLFVINQGKECKVIDTQQTTSIRSQYGSERMRVFIFFRMWLSFLCNEIVVDSNSQWFTHQVGLSQMNENLEVCHINSMDMHLGKSPNIRLIIRSKHPPLRNVLEMSFYIDTEWEVLGAFFLDQNSWSMASHISKDFWIL